MRAARLISAKGRKAAFTLTHYPIRPLLDPVQISPIPLQQRAQRKLGGIPSACANARGGSAFGRESTKQRRPLIRASCGEAGEC